MDTNLFSKLGVKLGGDIQSKMIDVTPELAHQILDLNVRNRKPTRQLVNHYASEMENGQWDSENGESIKLNRAGTLNDGQNRLLAVIKADVTVPMLVTFNTDPEGFKTIDFGKRRNGADVLHIQGYTYTKTMASAIRNIFILTGEGRSNYKITNGQILKFAEDNPEIEQYCADAHVLYDQGDRLFPASWIASVLFILSKIDKEEAMQFVKDLATGENLDSDDWVYRTRKRIAIIQRSPNKSMTRKGMANYIFHAWNLRRENRESRVFRVPQADYPDISKLK
jgi:hypothetical protein